MFPWSRYFKIACVATDGLFSVSVALVRLIGFLMLGVAEMVFSLSLNGSVDKRLHKSSLALLTLSVEVNKLVLLQEVYCA